MHAARRRFAGFMRVALASALLVAPLHGCEKPDTKVVDSLPAPYFPQPRAKLAPMNPTPAPPRVAQQQPRATIPRTGGEAGWMPRGGIDSKWKYIIVHHSAADKGSPQGIDSYHRQKGWDELGYHFVIGNGVDYPDGQIYVGSRWPKQKYGAHTRVSSKDDNRWNMTGIGICLIGDFDHTRPSRKQLASLARLISFLQRETGIPMARVVEHRDVDPHTRCAGRYFNLDQAKSQIASLSRSRPVQASTN